MADFPEAMLAGSLSLAGKVPTILAQGVTFPLASTVANNAFRVPMRALTAFPMSHTFTVEELQKNVKTAFGWIPAGVTVIGFSVNSADLDSGGTALVQSIYIGTTELVTSVTTGVAGTTGVFACIPTEVDDPTICYMKTTTAATTAAAGAVTITPLYYAN